MYIHRSLPYGWAWLLMLAAELARHDEGRRARTLAPLAEAFARRFRDFLPLAAYPVRVGTHYNTAFALRLTLDYAEGAGDAALADQCRERASLWHAADRDCQAWEPSQDEFLSPALMEAASRFVRIAQPGGEESLNVAAAAAICLHASASAAL